jgi:hypothetical protein
MKLLSVLVVISLSVGLAGQANAAKKKRKHQTAPASTTSQPIERAAEEPDEKQESPAPEGKPPAAEKMPSADEKKPPLDFDFFAGQAGTKGNDAASDADASEIEDKVHTRRWMLKAHQVTGMTTWALLAGTVVVGQLNYNELYGSGSGSQKWQNPHRILVLSTSIAFAATAAFALFAPTPYPKPLKFDTGLMHRIAVIGATLGMLTEGALGWVTTHQADAGNKQHLKTMARAHQIVGYSTLGFLTIAGTVWLF